MTRSARDSRTLYVHNLNSIVQDMNVQRPSSTMLPIFRSEAQFRILGELFTHPGAELTIGELAQRVDVPHPSVSREVARLTAAGLLTTRAQGNRTLVRADHTAPVAGDLSSMLSKVYGPVEAIRVALDAFAGIREAWIFGSFAARWQGKQGPAPNDIDLLVVGEVPVDDVWTAAAEASRKLGMEVNPVIRTPEEWDTDSTGFAAAVRNGPRIPILPQATDPDVVSET